MNIHTRTKTFLRFALIVFPAVALVLASCGNDTPTMCPLDGYGALEGYVRSSGQGISAEISAVSEEGGYLGVRTFRTTSDSTGWYRLELPVGLYRLEVSPGVWALSTMKSADTIRVTARVIRFDLDRCRAEIRIAMPDNFDGDSFSMTLEEEEEYGRVQMTKSQEDGWLHFGFSALLPGYYAMILGGNWQLGEPLYLRRPTAPGDVSRIWLGTDRVAVFEIDFRDTYATISGEISGGCMDADGGSVYLTGFSADSLQVGATRCASDGSYEWLTLLPHEVRLLTGHYGDGQWIGGDSFATARVFDLAPAARVTGVDLVASGFQLQLNGPGDLTVHRPYASVHDEWGNELFGSDLYENPFTFCNLRAGRYYLHLDGYCNEQVWAPQWYDGANGWQDATPIDLGEGEFRRLVMELVTGGSIEGELRTADGQLPDFTECGLFDFAGNPLCREWENWRWFTGGLFNITGLADGDYYLAARTESGDAWWYPGTLDFAEAVPITIAGLGAVTDLNWLLPPDGKEAGP